MIGSSDVQEKSYTSKQMEEKIIQLLEQWQQKRQTER